jgi:hypothetical protein
VGTNVCLRNLRDVMHLYLDKFFLDKGFVLLHPACADRVTARSTVLVNGTDATGSYIFDAVRA